MHVLDSKEIRELIAFANSNDYVAKVRTYSVFIDISCSFPPDYVMIFQTYSGELCIIRYDFGNSEHDGRQIDVYEFQGIFSIPYKEG